MPLIKKLFQWQIVTELDHFEEFDHNMIVFERTTLTNWEQTRYHYDTRPLYIIAINTVQQYFLWEWKPYCLAISLLFDLKHSIISYKLQLLQFY